MATFSKPTVHYHERLPGLHRALYHEFRHAAATPTR